MRHCPTCGFAAADVRDEIAHMRSAHPEIIRERLERAGIMEDELPLADQLQSAVAECDELRRERDQLRAALAHSSEAEARWLAEIDRLRGGSSTVSLIERQIEAALRNMDPFAPDTPNLNAWPQPNVRREFAEWLAARIDTQGAVKEVVWLRAVLGRIAAGHTHASKLAGEAVDESVARLPVGRQ